MNSEDQKAAVMEALSKRTLRHVDFGDVEYGDINCGNVVTSLWDANTVTSESIEDPAGTHYPVIDIDHACTLVPSTTPGHFHLYIDKAVPLDKYLDMLEAMAAAGIVQEGYFRAARARRFSAVRLPWVKKTEASNG